MRPLWQPSISGAIYKVNFKPLYATPDTYQARKSIQKVPTQLKIETIIPRPQEIRSKSIDPRKGKYSPSKRNANKS